MKDPRIFTSAIRILMHLFSPTTDTKFYKRLEADNSLIVTIVNNFKQFFFYPVLFDYDLIQSRSIDFIYYASQAPDVVFQTLFEDILIRCNEISTKYREKENDANNSQSSTQSTQTKSPMSLPKYVFIRLISLVGYLALKEMIFLDIDVYYNMKWRQEWRVERKKKKDNPNLSVSLDTSASNALKRLSGTNSDAAVKEEELMQGTGEDTIAELIAFICENELLYTTDSLFTYFTPLILKICRNPAAYNDNELQQAASLALQRFMLVSSKFCEENMPFLMNLLSQTTNIKIKCNIIIGVSDFMFRFPNIIDPWTRHFYAMIHDQNDSVRFTTVKSLTLLILHQMIRVKGQISDLALCIVDQNKEIQATAEEFFKEISRKDNTLYNVIPDIMSRLSDPSLNLVEEKFQVVMR